MKNYYFILGILCFLISSCQSITPLSIDYLLPAPINFPQDIKSVAVINNMPNTDSTVTKTETKEENGYFYQVEFMHGNASLAAESLAKNLAEANYFQEILICDSVLRSNDKQPRHPLLTAKEVESLSHELGADLLISLENLRIKAQRKVEYIPLYQAFAATTDLNVQPTLRIYIPGREHPLTTLQTNDSIFWEEYGGSMIQAKERLVNNENIIKQASEFAGKFPIQHLLPHWTTSTRYVYVGGTIDMRDAAVYVRENSWSEAIQLWERAYEQSKGKKKMRAAHNLAVGYEFEDQLTQSLEWARKAQALAYQIDKVELKKDAQGIDAQKAPNYALSCMYITELEKRINCLSLLNIQMERLKE